MSVGAEVSTTSMVILGWVGFLPRSDSVEDLFFKQLVERVRQARQPQSHETRGTGS